MQAGQEQAAIIEQGAAEQCDAAAQLGQRFKHRVVPEQNLQQERDIADQFDIAAGQSCHQPIARQPRDADREAEHGSKDDAEAPDQKCVEKADPERIAEGGCARRVRDQRLADVESGSIVPEAKARGDVGCSEIARGVDGGSIDETSDDRDERSLERQAAKPAWTQKLCDLSHCRSRKASL